jgi:hypothetical protein
MLSLQGTRKSYANSSKGISKGTKARTESSTTLLPCPLMDWEQVALNGGPPCFHVEDGTPERFCGRAKRWQGHGVATFHDYVSLEEFVASRRTGSVGADAAAVNAAREIAFALNRSHCTGDPIHQVARDLLGDASELGDIVEEFEAIVAPIIAKEFSATAPSSDAAEIVAEMAREALRLAGDYAARDDSDLAERYGAQCDVLREAERRIRAKKD